MEPVPPESAVVPPEAVTVSEVKAIPEVVTIFDPPVIVIAGLTLILMVSIAVAPTESVAVIVSIQRPTGVVESK